MKTSKLEEILCNEFISSRTRYFITKGIFYFTVGTTPIEIKYWLPIPLVDDHSIRLKDVISIQVNGYQYLNKEEYQSVLGRLKVQRIIDMGDWNVCIDADSEFDTDNITPVIESIRRNLDLGE